MRPLIATALVLAAAQTAAAQPTVQQLATRVPAAAQIVAGLDAAELRAHPLAQQWLSRNQQEWGELESDATRFFSEAGLDPARDVDALVVAALGSGPSPRWVAFFGGRYNPEAIGQALSKRGAAQLTIAGTTVYRLEGKGDGRSALLHLAADVVTIGDQETLLAVQAGPWKGNALVQEEVLAGHLDTRSSFWLVANVPERPAEIDRDPGAADNRLREAVLASRAVRRVAFQASLTDRLGLDGWAITAAPEDAELVRDALKGAIAAARLEVQAREPDLVDVLRQVDVQQAGNDVRATGSIPLPLLERALTARQR